ncbi:LacI family DNA-binding transcriptional regulator [Gryllotalpicola ginsengisoli]|uniref:LacI family DNA-binding transcriptional regulator n=1 Tax=Gryllotalpicola ginsengisoli TaxID=444608 RepID=UPI0003B49A9F|nr:LacI family DNA-binding transcriptional regulator [Gryllotalpicola ginsengisoli]
MGEQQGRRSAPTLHDVAREAGVSLATASRSLNGSARRVKDEYRARVLEAAARLNYAPNLSAQAVARGRTNAIGIIVSDITDPYFAGVAGGVFRAAESAGLVATIAVSGRDAAKEAQLVGALRGQKPRGLVLVGSRVADAAVTRRLERQLAEFAEDGGRVALVSQQGLAFDTVSFENRAGARELATRLAELGYRRFCVLAGPETLVTATERTEGFLAGIADAGLPADAARVVRGAFTRDGGYAAAGDALEHGERPELIFAANDVMAVGAMARLRDEGLEPGADVAVAGFDDIATLRDVTPGLTTVRLPLDQGGVAAVDLILTGDGASPTALTLPGHVVLRASTPPRL